MIDVCTTCCWGPRGADRCEYYHLPQSMRGESCQWWDLWRRFHAEEAERQNAERPRAD